MSKVNYFRHDYDVLLTIVASNKVRGHGPSIREINEAIGVKGHSTVQRSVGRLWAAGFIYRGDPHEPNALRPTEKGMAAAGFYPAEERIEDLGMGG